MEARPVAGPYRGERKLGLGLSGSVWRARGPRGVVALKVARTDTSILHAEAEVLKAASHPHLVRFVQHGPDWLATELVDGVPSHHWAAKRGTLEIVDLALEVSCALRHLHDRGLVHGDLKPANVLVDPWDHAKVIDPAGARSAVRGTPGFTAPEVVTGARATPASDAWSFGALLMALLTGAPPFPHGEVAAVLHASRHQLSLPPSTWRADVRPDLDLLVLALLSADPARRPTLADVERRLCEPTPGKLPRPIVGMRHARSTLLEALVRARDGEPTVVVLYGPQGAGRRTLLSEVIKRAAGIGLPTRARLDATAYLEAVTGGRRPAAGARASSAEAVEVARKLRESGKGGLLVLHADAPHAQLADLGATHVAPDALSLSDAQQLGRWLGVADDDAIALAWSRSEGQPRGLWLALEPYATRRTDDRSAFSVPMAAMGVLDALRAHADVLPMDRLAVAVGTSLQGLSDLIAMLLATGRITIDEDGWRVRLRSASAPSTPNRPAAP